MPGQKPDQVHLDLVLARVAMAWRHVAPPYVLPHGDPPGDVRSLRAWAWQAVFVDHIALADRARVALIDVRRAFESLRDNGLVYPDGTLHSTLDELLRHRYGGGSPDAAR